MVLCTQQDTKHVCSPAEVDIHRKINLESIPLCPEIMKALDKLCGQYKDIYSLHQGDIGHTKLLAMDIDT